MLSESALANKSAWEGLSLSGEESSEYENWLSSATELELEDSFGGFLEFGTEGLRNRQ